MGKAVKLACSLSPEPQATEPKSSTPAQQQTNHLYSLVIDLERAPKSSTPAQLRRVSTERQNVE